MKRLFASISAAALMAVGLFVASPISGSIANPTTAAACQQQVFGGAAYDSYWNPSRGAYGYIGFQAVKLNDCNQTFWGYIYVWSTDGYGFSGNISTRIWVNGNYGGATACSPSGSSWGCYTVYQYGGAGQSWSVDNCCGTNIRDAFGGWHSRYVSV